MSAAAARAAAVLGGDPIRSRRVIRQVAALIDPGARVVPVLRDSPDPTCGGDGCDSGTDEQG